MVMGARTRIADRKGKDGWISMNVSLQRDLAAEFEAKADALGLTVNQLLKYMILTSLKYQKPEDETVQKWVRGK